MDAQTISVRRNQAALPTWVWLGALLLAAVYLPTLLTPFDFVDDGNLVYPTRGLNFAQHTELWWQKVVANVEHLGPFRPVVWAHWHLAANSFGADAVAWRGGRIVWCGLAALVLLWFFHELKLHPIAALLTAAAAMWNPYRNEIWTSLTLAEGVAMPYALLALVAARKAATSSRTTLWDGLAVLGLLAALGCKNVFIAILPAMLLLRVWQAGLPLHRSVRLHIWRIAVYLTPVLLPAAHFIYFKTHWKPGYYETPGPSLEQARQFGLWLKGGAGADFLTPGVLLAIGVLFWVKRNGKLHGDVVVPPATPDRLPLLVAVLLLSCGFLVYLPMNIMSGRYTMPAVWGVDILLAWLLTKLLACPRSWPVHTAWCGLACGLVALVVAGANRQEKLTVRSRMLWSMLEHVERTAPPAAQISWRSGATELGELNVEEGIHFYWHLLHRGRGDVRIGLVDLTDAPIPRVELAPLPTPPTLRLSAKAAEGELDWQIQQLCRVRYRFGTRSYSIVLEARSFSEPSPRSDQLTEEWIRKSLSGFDPKQKLLAEEKILGPSEANRPQRPR